MRYRRMPIEVESPEQQGYDRIRNNLAESSVADQPLGVLGLGSSLDALVLQYGDHLGHPALRAAIAAETPGATADDVLLTPGAAAALFFIATALLEAGDHVVVARPNYATNIETPRQIGARISFLELRREDGWRVDPDAVAALLEPGTRLVSLTSPHNPTGQVIEDEALRAIVRIVERHGVARLLLDETYREMSFAPPPPPVASLSDRAISVSSFSKSYGMPGIRLGWLVTRDRTLFETLLAAKEQVVIGGSVVDEAIGWEMYRRRPELLPPIRAGIEAALATTRAWMAAQDGFDWVEPRGGVVGFPRIRPEAAVDPARFHERLFAAHGTIVGPGHWFERDRSEFRLGYGWPAPARLAAGLAALRATLDELRGSAR